MMPTAPTATVAVGLLCRGTAHALRRGLLATAGEDPVAPLGARHAGVAAYVAGAQEACVKALAARPARARPDRAYIRRDSSKRVRAAMTVFDTHH